MQGPSVIAAEAAIQESWACGRRGVTKEVPGSYLSDIDQEW